MDSLVEISNIKIHKAEAPMASCDSPIITVINSSDSLNVRGLLPTSVRNEYKCESNGNEDAADTKVGLESTKCFRL